MDDSPKNTIWLLYGNGQNPIQVFCNPENDPDMEVQFGPKLKAAIEQARFRVGLTHDGSNLSDVAAIICWDPSSHILTNLSRYPREKCILLAFEPPTSVPAFYTQEVKRVFGKVFILFDDLVDGETYIKFHFPLDATRWRMPASVPEFSDRKLCAAMLGNKYVAPHPDELYSERRRAVFELSALGGFDVYGSGWQGISAWKGEVPHHGSHKLDTLKHYRFVLSYENTCNHRGLISDKIHPVLAIRSVPVYLGPPDITDYVPKDCFIDKRDFASYTELHRFMKSIDERAYNNYLDAGCSYLTQDPRKNLFTTEHFVEQLMKQVVDITQGLS